MNDLIKRIFLSREDLFSPHSPAPLRRTSEEGGCGVVGFASSIAVRGRHIFEPSIQNAQ